MNFGQAVSSVFAQYVGFSGRARRSEYWYFVLFYVIVYLVAFLIDLALNTPVIALLVALALLLPSLAVGIRRLHDTGRSGWWVLIALVPLVGSIILIVFNCQDSQPGDNQYGPSPKYAGGQTPQGYPTPGYQG